MIPDLRLKEEDGMSLDRAAEIADQGPMIACVVRVPRISNFDDFDPLSRAGASVRFVTRPEELTDAHMVLLPGSKNTIADLRWMKSRGLDRAVAAAADRGSTVIGLCAGYQMLGRRLIDPDGSDGGTPASEDGLGLLDLTTRFSAEKTTARVDFSMAPAAVAGGWRGGERGTGYEIHSGASSPEGDDAFLPLVRIVDRNERARDDGRISKQGNVMGCYIHGFLDSPGVLQPLLVTVAAKAGLSAPRADTFSMDSEFDRLAAVMREALNMKLINQITGPDRSRPGA